MKKKALPKEGGPIGTLFLVATPIGNLEDITLRALRVLKEADALFCEDTRRTSILLRHFKIERGDSIESFHDHSSPRALARVRELLEQGRSVAYATDGGMPVVSDPGFVLVRLANQLGAKVDVIPGPSAAAMLFAASGLPSPKFFFHGFFPRTRGEVDRTLEVIKANPVVHIFYEAPGRIQASIELLARNLPEAEMVLGRELTKLHEEILRGSTSELHEKLGSPEKDGEKIRGECTLAVMGGEPEPKKLTRYIMPTEVGQNPEKIEVIELTDEQKAEVAAVIKSGVSSKDAAKSLSKKFRVPRRIIYEFIIRHLT